MPYWTQKYSKNFLLVLFSLHSSTKTEGAVRLPIVVFSARYLFIWNYNLIHNITNDLPVRTFASKELIHYLCVYLGSLIRYTLSELC